MTEQNSNTQYIVAASMHKANEELCLYFKNLKNGIESLQGEITKLEKKGLRVEPSGRRGLFGRRKS